MSVREPKKRTRPANYEALCDDWLPLSYKATTVLQTNVLQSDHCLSHTCLTRLPLSSQHIQGYHFLSHTHYHSLDVSRSLTGPAGYEALVNL